MHEISLPNSTQKWGKKGFNISSTPPLNSHVLLQALITIQHTKYSPGKKMMLWKVVEWLVYTLLANALYKLSRKMKGYALFGLTSSSPSLKPASAAPQQHLSTQNPSSHPTLTKTHVENFALEAHNKTVVCDINGALLRSCVSSSSFFPFFMLVAFEGGSIIRAFFLLISYPFSCLLLSQELKLRLMIFIAFCGLRVKDVENVGRTVLPKFYLEDLNPLVYEMWASAKGKVVITSVPRVMVEWFGKEYLGASHVLGTELQTLGGDFFFTGFIKSSAGVTVKHKALKELFGETKPDVGVGICSRAQDHRFLALCKEAYVVNKDTSNLKLPRDKYPKPLIFHDGRLAFLPTPTSTLSMFLFLPLALPLAVLRLLLGSLLPPHLSILLCCFTGIRLLFHRPPHHRRHDRPSRHVLYVSTHRTLLDPVMLSVALQKPLTAVTYSLSRLSELIAPIPTVRLTRRRPQDALTMHRLLSQGDLVVCPEGTTCREPYLLRFSSLFAELTDDIVPVAMEADVSMFYGTTASGAKWLDPVFFFMNPRPGYAVKVLDKVVQEKTCGGGGRSSVEVANLIQRELGKELKFECTDLTRKDKYLMLAGNEGFVGAASKG